MRDNPGGGEYHTAPTSCRLNVVVRFPPLYLRGGPKWRDNYPEAPDHPVASNRLETRMRRVQEIQIKGQSNLTQRCKQFATASTSKQVAEMESANWL